MLVAKKFSTNPCRPDWGKKRLLDRERTTRNIKNRGALNRSKKDVPPSLGKKKGVTIRIGKRS